MKNNKRIDSAGLTAMLVVQISHLLPPVAERLKLRDGCVRALRGARLALALATLLGAGAAGAQDLPYSSGSTGADGAFAIPQAFPQAFSPARGAHGMAFDAAQGEMVLFGGGNQSGNYSDTWTWRGTNWILQRPASSPSARSGMAMAYDAARSNVVLLGGHNGNFLNDTWVWSGTNWTQLSPSNSPPSGYLASMIYDVGRREIVVFGGNGAAVSYLNETWTWDGTNWTQKMPATSPSGRYYTAMAYDEARDVTVLYGGTTASNIRSDETWLWNGTNWSRQFPPANPGVLQGHRMAYDPVRREVLLYGGTFNGAGSGITSGMWAWNGTNWSQRAGGVHAVDGHAMAYDSMRQRIVHTGGYDNRYRAYTSLWDGTNWFFYGPEQFHFDMRNRPDGVWHFTTIDTAGVAIYFIKNAANTPVRWLASGNVTISGPLYLNGEGGGAGGLFAEAPKGGPGGYSGGLGGLPGFQGSSIAGHAGSGPGGGQPGLLNGEDGRAGTYASNYGNVFLQPLLGGSGGGGSAVLENLPGASGGGGGGAIEIACSRDLTITGSVQANGGGGGMVPGRSVYGGRGSGGGIRLQGDRITLPSGSSLSAEPDGRIWLGSYDRQLGGSISPANVPNTVLGTPVGTFFPDRPPGALAITNVAGQYVVQPPGGSFVTPDVTFTAPGDITVTVSGPTLPAGTPVRLRLTMAGEVITRPPVALAGGVANFTLTVPQGKGTLQALADLSAP